MSVGIVCHAGCGGSGQVGTGLALGLARRGHLAHLFCRHRPFFLRESRPRLQVWEVEPDAVPIGAVLDAEWPEADLARMTRLIVDVATTSGLDVLHLHYAVPFVEIAERIRMLLGDRAPAMVTTLHGTDVSIYGRRVNMGPRLRRHLTAMDRVTTVSAAHRALTREVLQLPDLHIEVIPNFVDVDRYRPGPTGRPDGGPVRIVHASNFRPVKNPVAVAGVLAAMAEHRHVEVVLVGDGPLLSDTLDHLVDLDLPVRHLGLRDDVEAILPLGDIALITSLEESFSLFALEASACGLPVVAPTVGGLPEVVLAGETGLLYPALDYAEAARLVSRLVDDPDLRRRLGSGGRSHALAFATDTVIPFYERTYADAMSEQRDARAAAEVG